MFNAPTNADYVGQTAGKVKGSQATGTPTSSTPALPVPPEATAPPPMFGANPSGVGGKPKRKSPGSFLGTGSLVPSINELSGKTLLGQ